MRADNDQKAHDLQRAAVTEYAAQHHDDRFVIGGDFNQPGASFAGFVTGTVNRLSIDRVFAASRWFRVAGTSSFRCTCSDHALVVVELATRTP